ncbi:MAG TPA: hypothetical protein VME67_09030 [Mycobacterium sp.]|nr:hypothetical protein [Mycobacterium sp.]HTX94970.1 hypothetical protein [Mycobacterium sp.]
MSRSHTAWSVDPPYKPIWSPNTVWVPCWLSGGGAEVSATRFTWVGGFADVAESVHGDEPGELAGSNDTTWAPVVFVPPPPPCPQPLTPTATAAAHAAAANTGNHQDGLVSRPPGRRGADWGLTSI